MTKRFLLEFVSLDFWHTGPWLRFAVDHASYVSFLPSVNGRFHEVRAHGEPSSFAIWNMQKVVVAFSTAVWVTNITLMIVCECHPSIL